MKKAIRQVMNSGMNQLRVILTVVKTGC